MKKKLIVLLLLFVCLCIFFVYIAYDYYTPPSPKQPYHISNHEDTLRIAYIGDSWAFMHKDHRCRISQLLEDKLHQPVRVHSYGICGLTSKDIYESMFDNSNFKHFLQKRKYAYCFVSVGINDTYKKMSINYYKKSINGIIQFMLDNNIFPIILEIPDYDIMKSFDKQTYSKKLLRKLSMLVNNTPLDCKQIFRNALNELIQEKKYQNKVRVIRYSSWNSNYHDDLEKLYKGDGLHLNELGYEKLDSVIIDQIITIYNFYNIQ